MKVQKYFMRTRMHGRPTPTGRPDYNNHFVWSVISCDDFVFYFLFRIAEEGDSYP